MAHQKESGLRKFYRVVVPKATSLGASVVVLGACFKIMHWPGAGVMLTVGLVTESIIFLMGVFEPPQPPTAHYEWERVYPELAEQTSAKKPGKGSDAKEVAAIAGLDKMLAEANLSADAFKKFGQGIQSLNDTALRMKDISEAVTATNQYAGSIKQASQSLSSLNEAYSKTMASMSAMADAAKEAKEYHTQVQAITKNLAGLNAVYEMELKDANSHLKAMNKFYSNLTAAMENMADASKESQLFKEQMSKLTSNLTTLNKVYGNMLTAMKG
jgi:gliding motility-associated protein GldL